jgi:hypothetical protein
MKNYKQVSSNEYYYDLSENAQKLSENSTFVIWIDNEGNYVGTDSYVKPCEATGNCFNIGNSLQDVIDFYEELAKESEIMDIEQDVKDYNEFDGQAILIIDSDGKISCTVGQSECCVPGYRVLFSKLLKEEPEFWVTSEEVIDKASEKYE